MIENTQDRDPLLHLIGAMGSRGTDGYAEEMERQGQQQLVHSDRLPARAAEPLAADELLTDLLTTDELVTHTLREATSRLLAECTEGQKRFFDRIFRKGLDKLTGDELRSAYDLCRRTVEKNRAGRQ